MKRILNILHKLDFEALFWLVALFYLTVINPYTPKHLNVCVFSLLGIDNCPGCGLGKSISMIFHGDIVSSFNTHPLGIPALLLIIKRIYQLIKNKIIIRKKLEVFNG